MSVYVAMRADGAVKIGTSTNPDLRMKKLEHSEGQRMVLLRVIDGTYPHEKWMHINFVDDHIYGEWFKFNPTMMTVLIPEDLGVAEQKRLEFPRKPDPKLAGTFSEEVAAIKELNKRMPGIKAREIAMEMDVSIEKARLYLNAARAEWQSRGVA